MIHNFLDNTFANPKLPRQEFEDLISTCLHRMEGQNEGGRYNALISDLQPHVTVYGDLMARQRQFLIDRHGKVRTVTEVLDAATAFATKALHQEAAYHLGEGSADYETLFPKGRTEFHNMTQATAPTILETLTDNIETLQAKLGPKAADLLTQAAALEDELDAAATAKGQQQGEVQGASAREKKLRAAAARQLKLNLLEQCILHIDEPDLVKALYAPKFLNWHANRNAKKAEAAGNEEPQA